LVNDILDLSKIEVGHIELSVAQFELLAAIQNSITLVRERLSRHGLKLEAEIDTSFGQLFADERKFKQILKPTF